MVEQMSLITSSLVEELIKRKRMEIYDDIGSGYIEPDLVTVLKTERDKITSAIKYIECAIKTSNSVPIRVYPDYTFDKSEIREITKHFPDFSIQYYSEPTSRFIIDFKKKSKPLNIDKHDVYFFLAVQIVLVLLAGYYFK